LIRSSVLFACFFIALLPSLSAQTGPSTFEFIENKGQWNPKVKFKGELASGGFFLRQTGFTVLLHHPDDLKIFNNHLHEENPDKKNKKIDFLEKYPYNYANITTPFRVEAWGRHTFCIFSILRPSHYAHIV